MRLSQRRPAGFTKWLREDRTASREIPRARIWGPQRRSLVSSLPHRSRPRGAQRWNGSAAGTVPDAHDPSKKHAPMMFTTDLSLKVDPIYAPIAKRFRENPQEFADAFAKAWYKLTHRDMGP